MRTSVVPDAPVGTVLSLVQSVLVTVGGLGPWDQTWSRPLLLLATGAKGTRRERDNVRLGGRGIQKETRGPILRVQGVHGRPTSTWSVPWIKRDVHYLTWVADTFKGRDYRSTVRQGLVPRHGSQGNESLTSMHLAQSGSAQPDYGQSRRRRWRR